MQDYKQKLIVALEEISPFWRAVQDGPCEIEKTVKQGVGPDNRNLETLIKLWSHYLHAMLRAKLYLKLPETQCSTGFEPEGHPRPLRQRDGELVNPLIVYGKPETLCAYAKPNPEWETAPQEWQFKFSPGVLVGPKNPDEFLEYDLSSNRFKLFDVWKVNPTKGSKYRATRIIH